jgi:hypothetical protein
MYKLIVIVAGVQLVNLETELETLARETYERVLKAGQIGGNDYSIRLSKDNMILERIARENGVLIRETRIPEKKKEEPINFFQRLFTQLAN